MLATFDRQDSGLSQHHSVKPRSRRPSRHVDVIKVVLLTIGMAISQRTIGEKTTSETRCIISSLPCDVIEFSRAVRSQWSIENSLHWRLDVVFREDDRRQRLRHSARAFSQLRRIARTTKCICCEL